MSIQDSKILFSKLLPNSPFIDPPLSLSSSTSASTAVINHGWRAFWSSSRMTRIFWCGGSFQNRSCTASCLLCTMTALLSSIFEPQTSFGTIWWVERLFLTLRLKFLYISMIGRASRKSIQRSSYSWARVFIINAFWEFRSLLTIDLHILVSEILGRIQPLFPCLPSSMLRAFSLRRWQCLRWLVPYLCD